MRIQMEQREQLECVRNRWIFLRRPAGVLEINASLCGECSTINIFITTMEKLRQQRADVWDGDVREV